MQNTPTNCPCGSTKPYSDCCQRLHQHWGDGPLAPEHTPEQLMRSRYCAFVLKNFDYIINTHHPDFIGDLTLDELNKGPHPQWLALDIVEANAVLSSKNPAQGHVTFKAW
ncbi:MAG: YchJ family protein, partial [Shewanella sp.]